MQNSFQQSQLHSLEILANSNISTIPNPAMAMTLPPRKSNIVATAFKTGISPVSDAVTKSTEILKIIADNQAEQTVEFVDAINSTTKSIATIPINISKSLAPTMNKLSSQISGLRENFQALTIKQEFQASAALFTMDRSKLQQAQFAKGFGSDARIISRLSSALLVAPSAVLVFTKPLNRIVHANMSPEERQTAILGSMYNVLRFSGQELVSIRKKDTVNKFDTTRLRTDTLLEKLTDKLNTTPIIAPIMELGRILNSTVDAVISPIETVKSIYKRVFPSKLSVGADLAAKSGLQFSAEKSAFQFLSNDFPNLAFETVNILNKQLGVQENIQATLEDLLTATTGQSTRRINQRDIIEQKVFDPFTAQYVTVGQEKKLQEDRVKQAFNVRRRERGIFGRLLGLGKKKDLEAANAATNSNTVGSDSNASFGSASETLKNKDTSFVTGVGKAATIAAGVALGPLALIAGLIGTSALKRKGTQNLLIDETKGVDFSKASQQSFSTQRSDNFATQSNVEIKQPKWQQIIEVELPKQSKLLGGVKRRPSSISKSTSSILPFNPLTAANPNNIQSIDNRLNAKRDPRLKIEEDQLKALTDMGDILKKGIPINGSSMGKKKEKKGNFLTDLIGSGIGGLVSMIGSGIMSLGSVLMGTLFGGGALLLLKTAIKASFKFLWTTLKTTVAAAFKFIYNGVTSLVKGAFSSILSFIKKIPFLGKAVSGIESLISKIGSSTIVKKVAGIGARLALKEAAVAGTAATGIGLPVAAYLQMAAIGTTAYEVYDLVTGNDDPSKTDVPTKSEKPVNEQQSSMVDTIKSGASTAFDYAQTGASTVLKYGKIGLNKLNSAVNGNAQNTSNSNLPRGVRNNNPGNLRDNVPWLGTIGSDNGFAIFDTPEHGIRAAAKNIKAYYTKHNINTVRGVISRWAPSSENDTSSYINDVSSKLGVAADDTLNMVKAAPALLAAIFNHENGGNYFPPNMITSISNAAISAKSTANQAFKTAKSFISQSADTVSSVIGPMLSKSKAVSIPDYSPMVETAKGYVSQASDTVSSVINPQPGVMGRIRSAVLPDYSSMSNSEILADRDSKSSVITRSIGTVYNMAKNAVNNVNSAIGATSTPFSYSTNDKSSGFYNNIESSPKMTQTKMKTADSDSKFESTMSDEVSSLRRDLNSYMETNVAISKQLSINLQTLSAKQSTPAAPVVVPVAQPDNTSNQGHSMYSVIDKMFSNIPNALSYQSVKFAGLSQEVAAHA